MANKIDHTEIIVYIAGFSSNAGYENIGVGKSYLCHKLMQSSKTLVQHSSIVSQMDFMSSYINQSHWLYWGTLNKPREDKLYKLIFIEKTEFLDENNYKPFINNESCDYVERCGQCQFDITKKCYTGKFISQKTSETLTINPSNYKPNFVLLLYDLSKSENDTQFKIFKSLLSLFVNMKVSILIVLTKYDSLNSNNLRMIENYLSRKAARIPKIYTSTIKNVNIFNIPDVIIDILTKDVKYIRQMNNSYDNGLIKLENYKNELKNELKTLLQSKLKVNPYLKWFDIKNTQELNKYIVNLNPEQCNDLFKTMSNESIKIHRRHQNQNTKGVLSKILIKFEHLIDYDNDSQKNYQIIIRNSDFQSYFVDYDQQIEHFELDPLNIKLPRYLINDNYDDNMLFFVRNFISTKIMENRLYEELMKDWLGNSKKSFTDIQQLLTRCIHYEIESEIVRKIVKKFTESCKELMRIKLFNLFHQYACTYLYQLFKTLIFDASINSIAEPIYDNNTISSVNSNEESNLNDGDTSKIFEKVTFKQLNFDKNDNSILSQYSNIDFLTFEQSCIEMCLSHYKTITQSKCFYSTIFDNFPITILPKYLPKYSCFTSDFIEYSKEAKFKLVQDCCNNSKSLVDKSCNCCQNHHKIIIVLVEQNQNQDGLSEYLNCSSILESLENSIIYNDTFCNIHNDVKYKIEIITYTFDRFINLHRDLNNNNVHLSSISSLCFLDKISMETPKSFPSLNSCSRLCFVVNFSSITHDFSEIFNSTNQIIDKISGTNHNSVNLLKFIIWDSEEQKELVEAETSIPTTFTSLLFHKTIGPTITLFITDSLISPIIWITGFCGDQFRKSKPTILSYILNNLKTYLQPYNDDGFTILSDENDDYSHILYGKYRIIDADSLDNTIYDNESFLYPEDDSDIKHRYNTRNNCNLFRIEYLSFHEVLVELNKRKTLPHGIISIADMDNKTSYSLMANLLTNISSNYSNILTYLLAIRKKSIEYPMTNINSNILKKYKILRFDVVDIENIRKENNNSMIEYFHTIFNRNQYQNSVYSTPFSSMKSSDFLQNISDIVDSVSMKCDLCCLTCRAQIMNDLIFPSSIKLETDDDLCYFSKVIGYQNKHKYKESLSEHHFDAPHNYSEKPIKIRCNNLNHFDAKILWRNNGKGKEESPRPYRTRIRSQSGPELPFQNAPIIYCTPKPLKNQTVHKNSTISLHSNLSANSSVISSRHSYHGGNGYSNTNSKVNLSMNNSTHKSSKPRKHIITVPNSLINADRCHRCGRIFSSNLCLKQTFLNASGDKNSDKAHHHHHLIINKNMLLDNNSRIGSNPTVAIDDVDLATTRNNSFNIFHSDNHSHSYNTKSCASTPSGYRKFIKNKQSSLLTMDSTKPNQISPQQKNQNGFSMKFKLSDMFKYLKK